MELFKLYGSVFVESSEAQRKISELANNAKNLGNNFDDVQKNIRTVMNLLKGTAIVAAFTGAFKLAKDTADNLDAVDKGARNMGVSNRWYQQWDYIAKICGTDMNTISTAVENMNKRVGDASDSTVQALGQLGISMIDAKDAKPEELFEKVSDRLAEITDPATKAAIASAIFGGAWKGMGTVLSTKAEEIQDLKDECEALGGVMSDEDIAKAAGFEDALTRWDTAVTGLKNNIGVELIPVVQPIIEQLTNAVVWLSAHVPAAFDAMRDSVNGLISAARRIGSVFGGGGSARFSGPLDMTKVSVGTPSAYTSISPGVDFHLPARGSASGLDYAPYNGYPARLHRGEAVVAAGAADTSSGGLTVTQVFQQRPKTEAERAEDMQRLLQEMRWAD